MPIIKHCISLPAIGRAMAMNDIFYVRKGPDGKWSKPVNLGYPINTISREGTLFIAADGKTAYYASDKSDSKRRNGYLQF